MKIFRDSIWGPMRPLFQAHHRYNRKNGLYDFPQKRPGIWLMNLFLPWLLRIPPVKALRNLPKMMTARFGKVVGP
jgi:hypothetical protein